MPLGHSQPQDVTEHTGIPVGNGPRGRDELGGEDRLLADHPPQRREPPGVSSLSATGHDEAVEVTPGETDLDPDPRLRGLVERRRDGILELSVEMGQAAVDDHGRNRQR